MWDQRFPQHGGSVRGTRHVRAALVCGDVVADDHAALHDEAHTLHLVHVGERVPGNGDDVCKLAFFDRADIFLNTVVQHVGGIMYDVCSACTGVNPHFA
jgi:hypothetical protein